MSACSIRHHHLPSRIRPRVFLAAACVLPVGAALAQDEPPIKHLIRELAEPKRRARAAQRLVLMGESAARPLLAALDEPGVDPMPIYDVLGRLGPDAVVVLEPLAARLAKVAPRTLPGIIRALADITPFAEPDAVTQRIPFTHTLLVARTRTRDRALSNRIGFEAHRFLNRRTVDTRVSVGKLIEVVQSNQIFIRVAAIEALGRRGAAAESAIPVLVAALKRRDHKPVGATWHQRAGSKIEIADDLAQRCAEALLRIAAQSPRVALAWGYRLRTAQDWHRRVHAARVLERFGLQAADATVDLIAAVGDANPRVQVEAVKALTAIGPRARAALPILRRLRTTASGPLGRAIDAAVPSLTATPRVKRLP